MKTEIKYLFLIVAALYLGLVGMVMLRARPAAVAGGPPAGEVTLAAAGGAPHALARHWSGSGQVAALLGLNLDSTIAFELDQRGAPSVRYRVGGANAPEMRSATALGWDKGGAHLRWKDGTNEYEFIHANDSDRASLRVMRSRVGYLVPLASDRHAAAAPGGPAGMATVWPVLRDTARESWYLVAPRFIALVVLYLLVAGGFHLVVWILLKKRLASRKVQEGWPKKGRLLVEFGHSILVIFSMALFSYGSVFVIESGYSKVYKNVADYGWGYWFFSLAIIILLMDAFTYWTHRMMHHRSLFKYFHAIHHRSHHPSPWTTLSMSVNEIILNAIFMPAVLMMMPVHQQIAIVFTLWTLFKNVFNHLGFELFPNWINKWLVGATYHETHHMKFHGNYSSYFTLWDKLMHTETQTYRDNVERIRGNVEAQRQAA
ncbi:MAG: sterol desaturase family protein [Pseudomonadota bacterium]